MNIRLNIYRSVRIDKSFKSVFIGIIAALIVLVSIIFLARSFVLWKDKQAPVNTFNALFEQLEVSQIESIQVYDRKNELSDSEISELVGLIKQVKLAGEPTQQYQNVTGGPPFHQFHIWFKDGTELILGVNSIYYIVTDDPDYLKLPRKWDPASPDYAGPIGYRISGNDCVYLDIIQMWESLGE